MPSRPELVVVQDARGVQDGKALAASLLGLLAFLFAGQPSYPWFAVLHHQLVVHDLGLRTQG